MNILNLLHGFLTMHLIGVILFIGTTVIDFVALRQFWILYNHDQGKAKIFFIVTSRFQTLIGVGILLILATAIGMMALTHGAFGEQTWLRVKFPIVVMAIFNGLLLGRREANKLKRLIQSDSNNSSELLKIKSWLSAFHAIQFTLFFAIIMLSVYKFA